MSNIRDEFEIVSNWIRDNSNPNKQARYYVGTTYDLELDTYFFYVVHDNGGSDYEREAILSIDSFTILPLRVEEKEVINTFEEFLQSVEKSGHEIEMKESPADTLKNKTHYKKCFLQ